ncbi:MAG: SpoIID/LytB domain-containing protein [Candidatus Dormibacteria bacterium]
MSAPAAADSTQDQLQQLRAQEASQRSQLDQLSTQRRDAQGALNQLKANLDAVNADLGAAYQQLQALQDQVKTIERRENVLQQRHDRRIREFLDSTRMTYKKGTGEWVLYLFNSSNFSTFLDRLAYVTAVSRHDIAEAERLRQEREAIGRERRKTEELALQLQPILAQIAARVGDVSATYHAEALVESQIEQQQRAQLAALLGTQHQEKQLEAALAAAQAAAEAAAQKGSGRVYGSVCPAVPAGMVIFCGHGFGHGVGMGQYGALGMAQAGIGWQRIVTSFYSGSSVAVVPDQTVRVFLHAASGNITPHFSGATIEDLAGASLGHVAEGTAVNFTRSPDGSIEAAWAGGAARSGTLRLVPDTAGVFQVGGSGTRYRGEAWLDGSSGLKVINHVPVESYLQGLAEVPSSWPLNAIAAQIVAARTYALYHLGGGTYDVTDTTASQVYGGFDRETPQQNAAVAASRGQALYVQGHLIDAVFSSSDGGHTECASAEWGQGDNPCSPSYLRGVIDNYDVSPLHTWYTPAHKLSEIQGYLMAGGVYNGSQCGVLDHFVFTRDASNRVRQVQMVGDKGACASGIADFMSGLNRGSPSDFIVYGEMFGVTPGSRSWPYF